MSWSRRPPAAAAAALAACLAAWAAAVTTPRDFPAGTFVDDAHYAVLAQSLRERRTYRTISLPDRPAETKYPPVWPATLALAWNSGVGGEANLQRLRLVNLALAGPLAAALALAGIALGLSAPVAAAGAAAGVLAPRFAGFWTLPLSEPLCLLFLALGVLAWARGRHGAALAAFVLATWTRTVAAPFVLAAAFLECRADRRRGLRQATLAALGLAPWAVWSFAHRADVPGPLLGFYGSYGAWLGEAVREDAVAALLLAPLRNALTILRSLGESPGWWGWVPAWLATALGVAIMAALWLARRRAPLPALGVLGYAVFVLWWPFPGDRFVAALWPLALLVALLGVPERARAAAVAAVLVLAMAGLAAGQGVREHRVRGRSWLAMREAVASRLPAGATVAAPNPALYYLSTGLPAVPNGKMRTYRAYRSGDLAAAWGLEDDLWAIVARYRPRFVITGGGALNGRPAADRLYERCPGVLAAAWLRPDGAALFVTNPDAPCAPPPWRPTPSDTTP